MSNILPVDLPSFSNVLYSNNNAQSGGGIFVDFNIKGAMHNCTFLRNIASSGAGMYNKGATMVFTTVNFLDNKASTGGAFTFTLNTGGNNQTLFNNIIANGNNAFIGGAGYILPSRTNSSNLLPVFSNVEISNNMATYGAGFYFETSTIPPSFLPPIRFANNYARHMGGAMFVNTANNVVWMSDAVFENK